METGVRARDTPRLRESGRLHLRSLPAGVALGMSLPLSGPRFLHPGKGLLDTTMLEALSSPEIPAFGNKVGCGKI